MCLDEGVEAIFRSKILQNISVTVGIVRDYSIRELTGMPQLVEIPAPVMTTIFFADARALATF